MPGTVTVSQLIEDDVGEVSSYVPLVTYAYVVNGQALQCSRVRIMASKSKKVLAKYPKDSAVQVFFDPQKPSTAVLEKGGSAGLLVMMFVGIAVILGSCVVGLII